MEKTLLIVDDEPKILNVCSDYLEAEGFTVHTASDGREALSIIQRKIEDIDLILSDQRMPRLNGLALLKTIKKTYQNPPEFIFMSGYTDVTTEEIKFLGAKFIKKPFELDDLLTLIHSTLQK